MPSGAQPDHQKRAHVLRLRARGLSVSEIARRIGRTRQAVHHMLKSSADPTRTPAESFWTPAKDALLGTMPDQDVADQLGCSHRIVWSRRQFLGIAPHRRYRTAAGGQPAHDDRTYSEKQRARVLQLRAEGLSMGEIARRVRRTRQAVQAMLRAAGDTTRLPKASMWTPEKDALLGTMTDQALADRLGCSDCLVWQRRRQLGIEAHGRSLPEPAAPPVDAFWTPEKDELLGTMTDRAAAAQLGCKPHAVWSRRRYLGIAACTRGGAPEVDTGHRGASPHHVRRKRLWRLRAQGLSIVEIARRLGISRQAVHKMLQNSGRAERLMPTVRWSPAKDALLGTLPDEELAQQFGCSAAAVQHRRDRLGVAARGRRSADELLPAGFWTAETDALLGTISDQELARQLGCSHTAVRARRQRLDIAPCHSDGGRLSPLHWWILQRAAPQEQLTYVEILIGYFGWKPRPSRRGRPPAAASAADPAADEVDLDQLALKVFSKKHIGEPFYQQTMAALTVACGELECRGLIQRTPRAVAQRTSVALTEAGRAWLAGQLDGPVPSGAPRQAAGVGPTTRDSAPAG